MEGLLFAGGHGTCSSRSPSTGTSKLSLPHPFLFCGLRHHTDADIKEVAIVLGPLHEGICETVGEGKKFGLDARYIALGDRMRA